MRLKWYFTQVILLVITIQFLAGFFIDAKAQATINTYNLTVRGYTDGAGNAPPAAKYRIGIIGLMSVTTIQDWISFADNPAGRTFTYDAPSDLAIFVDFSDAPGYITPARIIFQPPSARTEVSADYLTQYTTLTIKGRTDGSPPPPDDAKYRIYNLDTSSEIVPWTKLLEDETRQIQNAQNIKIEFNSVFGYNTPPELTFNTDTQNQAVGNYTTADITFAVDVSPDGAADQNPSWSWTNTSGQSGSGFGDAAVTGQPGTYTFSFDPTPNWNPPGGNPQITIPLGDNSRTLTATYIAKPVTITVEIDPDESQGPWSYTGPGVSGGGIGDVTFTGIPGTYEFTFEDNDKWTADGRTVSISLNGDESGTVTCTYRKKVASVKVNITNTGNLNINTFGASWTMTASSPAPIGPAAVQTFPLTGSGATTTIDNVPFGTYTVTFGDTASGFWTTPGPVTVTVGEAPPAPIVSAQQDGVATPDPVIGEYVEKTNDVTITMNSVPTGFDISTFGASWNLAGNSDNGETISISGTGLSSTVPVPYGDYTVTFNETASGAWTTPGAVGLTIDTSVSPNPVTGTYEEKTGSVTINIADSSAVRDVMNFAPSWDLAGTSSNGKSITRSGNTTSKTLSSLPYGIYTVTFNATASGAWKTPPSVNVILGDSTSPDPVTGSYGEKLGSFTVNITDNNGGVDVNNFGPSFNVAGNSDNGEAVSLDGLGSSTTFNRIPHGTYAVTFNDATSGAWKTPASVNVTIGDNTVPDPVEGEYIEKTGDATILIADNSTTLDVNTFGPSWDLTGTSTNGESINLAGSGATTDLIDVPFGSYEVTFNDTTSGAWNTPGATSIEIDHGVPDTTGIYTGKLGSFTIVIASDNISAGNALADGASFAIAGTTDNGEAFTAAGSSASNSFNDVPFGSYTLTFADINLLSNAPWDKPDDISVNVSGDMGTYTGTYIRHLGSLTVYIGSADNPSVATGSLAAGVEDEGGWRIAGTTDYLASGEKADAIPTGKVFIEFAPVSSFSTPDPMYVTVKKGINTTVVAFYNESPVAKGSLTITCEIEELQDMDMWKVGNLSVSSASSIAYLKPGDVVHNIPAGEVKIDFNLAPGCVFPDFSSVTVKPDILNSFEANYCRTAVVHKSDYDGDGSDDLAVYDKTTRRWQVARTTSGKKGKVPAANVFIDKQFGIKGDIMAPGDYNGDGLADLALYRPATGEWKVQGMRKYSLKNFGEEGDIPVPGDYNGDGLTDPALFRPTTGHWLIYDFDTEKVVTVKFGEKCDVPVPGNWDGDQAGITDLAVFNAETGNWKVAVYSDKKNTWKLRKKLGGQYGQSGDLPIHGDYNGDGTTDMAVYVRNKSLWKVKDQFELEFGLKGDIPVPNDWAGLGRVIPAVFRVASGRWLAIDNLLRARHGQGGQPLMSGR